MIIIRKKLSKSKFRIKTKAIKTPKGYRVSDIDKSKRGITIFYKGKKK